MEAKLVKTLQLSLLHFWTARPAVYAICGLLLSGAFLLSVKNGDKDELPIQNQLCRETKHPQKHTAGTRGAAL